ncbi:MAG: serine/threonine protein kinase [Sandaracinaceae bacterium]|nr:serine/threonine protein kinase [Sandaracinaceae bacterium]
MSSPGHTRESFLQHRLGRFGVWGFAAIFGGLLLRLALELGLGGAIDPVDLGGHTVASLALLGLWAIMRRPQPLSPTTLAILDVLAMNALTLGFCVMAVSLPLPAHPSLILLLTLTFSFTLRATYVPSTTRQTLLVHATALVWLIATAIHLAGRHAAAGDSAADSTVRAQVITVTIWWAFNSGAAAAATSVIYGLRREVREATQLGQYTLESKLGEGGMGEVYRARHAMLRRPTAVKLLPPERSGEATIARFEREVQRTASLSHPNVVTVFDYGRTPDGIFYYAMEHLDGLDLSEVVRRHGPLDPRRVVHVLLQICEGLAEAHAVGLVHRDIKPANVFLTRSGRAPDVAKLVDFGLVKDVDADDDAEVSGEGRIVGTPQCMAPEAITAPESVDERSDLYAVGAVAYYLLAGRHVFPGRSIVQVVSQHLRSEPAPLARPDLPAGLDEIVLRCLAKDPADRPASAIELRDLLLSLEDVRPWTVEEARAWWAAAGDDEPGDADAELPAFSVDLSRRA